MGKISIKKQEKLKEKGNKYVKMGKNIKKKGKNKK